MSNKSKRKRGATKPKERDDASELWCPSPPPSEDWGDDADKEFEMEIVGEEVAMNGEMRYEVRWKNWRRKDGTNTTWQGPNLLPLDLWERDRIAALPDTTEVEVWGSVDIVNTQTRLRKQGYETPTEEELEAFQAKGDEMVRRMEELMAESKEAFPELFPDPPSRAQTRAPTTAPLPQRSRVNAQAGSSRPHVNAEAGSSRLRPPDAPWSAAPKPRIQVTPLGASSSSSSRPPPKPRSPIPLPPPRPRAASPAISISSVDSVEFIPKPSAPPPPPKCVASPAFSVSSSVDSIKVMRTKPKPSALPPPLKRKATSPPEATPSPPPKRRGLPPVNSDAGCVSLPVIRAATTSGPRPTASMPFIAPSAAAKQSRPHTSRSSTPAKSASAAGPSTRASSPISTSTSFRPPPSTRASSIATLVSASAPPRRLLKRRLPDDDDDDPVQQCECGTLLPPPDIRRHAVCDTCRDTATSKRWHAARDEEDRDRATGRWRSASSTVRASSAASTRVDTTSDSRAEWWNFTDDDKMKTETGPVMGSVISVPSPSAVRKGKGKAPERTKSLRLRIESEWTAIAQGCDGEEGEGAKGITFVNDVDDEEIPPSLHGGRFEYLEDHYRLTEALELKFMVDPDSATPLSDPAWFTSCQCVQCDEFDGCCQDTGAELGYAYTDRLFNFTYRTDDVVVECNPYCQCPTTCNNRVVQRPRQVAIEVFKTQRCGWGVRAPVDIVKGTVLGVYTGKLISRAEAEALRGDRRHYCFDLDYYDGDDTYVVDAFECGNWTRFINHSCSPNLRVQPVVYDTLPHQRIAFLAVIATERIPARTEFTFDYDPEAQRDYDKEIARKGNRKQAQRRPSGTQKCVCGAQRCRGWVRDE
ncbi:hypothetical protein K438DRAFT_15781 [Mycena galopus ATCC 62051]|nr:hypothetical protein K438DRAFT_15781 [Mycena galopus ATCC 62051]